MTGWCGGCAYLPWGDVLDAQGTNQDLRVRGPGTYFNFRVDGLGVGRFHRCLKGQYSQAGLLGHGAACN